MYAFLTTFDEHIIVLDGSYHNILRISNTCNPIPKKNYV